MIAKKWHITLCGLILFAVLATTGLVNLLFMPKGYASGGGVMYISKRLTCFTHELAGLLFIPVIGIHVAQHWKYIRSKLKG